MADKDYEGRLKSLGRNEACSCGSGKKYKKCHLAADEEASRKAQAKAAAAAVEPAKGEEPAAEKQDKGSNPEAKSHIKKAANPAVQHSRPAPARPITTPRKAS